MLVLSRKRHEKLILTLADGREIEVSVQAIAGNRTSIGVVADRDIRVRRGELPPPQLEQEKVEIAA